MTLPSRTKLRTALALSVALGLVLVPFLGATADTADPSIALEGWFARSKPRAPQTDVPCPPEPLPSPPTGCGPVSIAPVPAPQAPDTGAYVVATAGGDAGRSDSSGDIGWAAFQWDLFSYVDATVEKFEVVLTQAPDNAHRDFGTPVMQACNIVAPWGAEPGANPWPDRPSIDFSDCVVPEALEGDRWRFDVTPLAQGWIDGDAYGMAVVPGTPEQRTNLQPFQLTFAGYYSTAENAEAVRPRVAFEFTGAGLDEPGFDSGFGDDLSSAPFDEPFSASPDIDVFPGDVGSAPIDQPEPVEDGGDEVAAPRRTVPASHDPGFPWYGWLLVPLGLLAFFGTGTALGDAGEPVLPREGGVSRLLARRQAKTGPAPPR